MTSDVLSTFFWREDKSRLRQFCACGRIILGAHKHNQNNSNLQTNISMINKYILKVKKIYLDTF